MYKVVVTACSLVVASLVATVVWRSDGVTAEFTFNNGLEVNSLDPHVISWKHDIRIANALFEGLMAFDVLPPSPGERIGRLGLTDGVADTHTVSDDGLIYTSTPTPCVALGATLLCLNFVGDGLRDALDPTGKRADA